MKLTPGSESQTVYVILVDPTTGVEKTGVDVTTLDLTYTRDRATPVRLDLTALGAPNSPWASGGAIETDGTNAPGQYRVDVPNAALVAGVARVQLAVVGATVKPANLEVELETLQTGDAYGQALKIDSAATATPAAATSGSLLDRLANKDGSKTYSQTTDALEALRDRGDSAWTTADLTALLAAVQAVQNNTRTTISLPGVLERPDASVTRFKIYLNCYDEQGNMEEPDSAPTVAVANQDGTDRSGNLQNPVTHVDTTTMVKVSDGRYWIEYEMASDHACPEALTFTFTIVEGAATRYADRGALVVDTTAVDFTTTDRIALQAIQAVTDLLPDAGGLDDLAAILTIVTRLIRYQANKRTLSQSGVETVKADNGQDDWATRPVTDKNDAPVAPGAGIPATLGAFVEA
jgi:hypothetical protein